MVRIRRIPHGMSAIPDKASKMRLTKTEYNRMLIRAILFHEGPASRVELGRKTGLPLSAMTDLTSELIRQGDLIAGQRVRPSEKGAGRNRTLLDINRSGIGVICLVYEVRHVEAMICDLNGGIVWSRKWKGPFNRGPDHLLKRLSTSLKTALKETPIPKKSLLAIGAADPGLIDRSRGIALRALNIPGWRDVHICRHLRKTTDLRVIVERFEGLQAMSEVAYGVARGAQNMIYAAWTEDGIGGAFVVDGKALHGRTGSAGEIGHFAISAGGPQCSCGRRGCLEAHVLPKRLVDEWRQKKGNTSIPKKPLVRLIQESNSGDSAAGRILEQASQKFGRALGGISNLLDPECIVLGGAFAERDEASLSWLRRGFLKTSFRETARDVQIHRAVMAGNPAPGLAHACACEYFAYPSTATAEK